MVAYTLGTAACEKGDGEQKKITRPNKTRVQGCGHLLCAGSVVVYA